MLECTILRTQIALRSAELPFTQCECRPPHIHTGLGATWIAVTLLSVRQESQLNLRCSDFVHWSKAKGIAV